MSLSHAINMDSCVVDLKDHDKVFSVLLRPGLKGPLMVQSFNNYSLYYSLFSGLLRPWINPKKGLH